VQRGAVPRAYPPFWFGLHENDTLRMRRAIQRHRLERQCRPALCAHQGRRHHLGAGRPVDPRALPGPPERSLFGSFFGFPVSHTYNDVLPSANLKLDLTKDLIGRFAVAETMTRPDYSAARRDHQSHTARERRRTGSGSGSNPD